MPEGVRRTKSKVESLAAIASGAVVAGTAWLWSDEELEKELDYLFIDEAGQMSLAMALAAGRSAKNIVLLGDPQQLEQPQLDVRSRERSPLGLPTHLGCIGFPERVIGLTLSGPHSHLTLSTSFKHDALASLQFLRSPIG